MKLFLTDIEEVSVDCAIPYEHFKVLVEAYRRGYVTEVILPVEYNGTPRVIALSAVDTATTFAEIYMQANYDRKQLEAFGLRAKSQPPTPCELGGGK